MCRKNRGYDWGFQEKGKIFDLFNPGFLKKWRAIGDLAPKTNDVDLFLDINCVVAEGSPKLELSVFEQPANKNDAANYAHVVQQIAAGKWDAPYENQQQGDDLTREWKQKNAAKKVLIETCELPDVFILSNRKLLLDVVFQIESHMPVKTHQIQSRDTL